MCLLGNIELSASLESNRLPWGLTSRAIGRGRSLYLLTYVCYFHERLKTTYSDVSSLKYDENIQSYETIDAAVSDLYAYCSHLFDEGGQKDEKRSREDHDQKEGGALNTEKSNPGGADHDVRRALKNIGKVLSQLGTQDKSKRMPNKQLMQMARAVGLAPCLLELLNALKQRMKHEDNLTVSLTVLLLIFFKIVGGGRLFIHFLTLSRNYQRVGVGPLMRLPGPLSGYFAELLLSHSLALIWKGYQPQRWVASTPEAIVDRI